MIGPRLRDVSLLLANRKGTVSCIDRFDAVNLQNGVSWLGFYALFRGNSGECVFFMGFVFFEIYLADGTCYHGIAGD